MQITSPKCPNCGAGILDPNAKFCAHCGSAIVVTNTSQPLPTVASLLELGKSLLAAGNSKEADKQFILVLQKEPGNKEAWLWRGACAHSPEENSVCWEKSGFTRAQIISNLADVMSGRILLNMFLGYFLGLVQTIFGNEAQAVMYLDAALKVKRDPASRRDWLDSCELLLLSLSNELNDLSPEREKVRGYCSGLLLLFDRMGPEQPSDILKGNVNNTGISNMLAGRYNHPGFLWSNDRDAREKPSYWRKYIQQILAKLPK